MGGGTRVPANEAWTHHHPALSDNPLIANTQRRDAAELRHAERMQQDPAYRRRCTREHLRANLLLGRPLDLEFAGVPLAGPVSGDLVESPPGWLEQVRRDDEVGLP